MSNLPEFDPDWILLHENGLLAVNKPAGIPVHADSSHNEGLNEMIGAWIRLHPGVLDIRTGKPIFPVHHLEREATGVTLFSLRRQIATRVTNALTAGAIRRTFLTVVSGPVDSESGTIKAKIRTRVRHQHRRQSSQLKYKRICGDDRLSLLEVEPEGSGRHVVRALLAEFGRAIAGDQRYGKPKPARQFLEKFNVEHFLLQCVQVELPREILNVAKSIEARLPDDLFRIAEQKGWEKDAKFTELAERLTTRKA